MDACRAIGSLTITIIITITIIRLGYVGGYLSRHRLPHYHHHHHNHHHHQAGVRWGSSYMLVGSIIIIVIIITIITITIIRLGSVGALHVCWSVVSLVSSPRCPDSLIT